MYVICNIWYESIKFDSCKLTITFTESATETVSDST